jgi:gamma-glutamyl:cysteine ligase YbdK (ATP-grasp superfamily)
MIFHQKRKEIDEDPYRNYQVLCGIEEEFLIINKEGTLLEIADDVMVKAAEILENDQDLLNSLKVKIRGLDAEPSPAQIEYVTLPLPPTLLKDAIIDGRTLLSEAANKLGAKILAQSLHPIQSDPNPIVGTHINVSVQQKGGLMKPGELKAVYNYLWNYLPELIAITANSPLYMGDLTNVASNRYLKSNVLKLNGSAKIKVPDHRPALIPMRYYGRMRYSLKIGTGEDEFSKSVITNTKGSRLVDITPRGPLTNIGDDKDDSPTRTRVEVRVIDVQQESQPLLDIVYLCCVSALHAVYLDLTGVISTDPYHKVNVENAVTDGVNATLIRGENKKETVEESVSRWVEDTKKYQDYLGINLQKLTYEKLRSKQIQSKLNIEVRTKTIERMRQQGKVYALILLRNPRIVADNKGNQYKISGNTKVNGNLSVDYKLTYKEENNLVTNFEGIEIVNTLDVQGLKIPLEESDQILNVLSESEYLSQRLFGGLFF